MYRRPQLVRARLDNGPKLRYRGNTEGAAKLKVKTIDELARDKEVAQENAAASEK